MRHELRHRDRRLRARARGHRGRGRAGPQGGAAAASVTIGLEDVAPRARGVLIEELAAFTAAQSNLATQQRYASLVDAVDKGEIPDDLVPALEVFLELVLSNGRLRKEHGVDADNAL